jgi:hypothetical protein
MNKHPLTDEICDQMRDSIPKLPCDEYGKLLSYDGQRILDGMFEEHFEVSNAEMRTAADWQLEQVNDFFVNYRKAVMGAYPGHIPSLTELLSLMNQAMRPTQEEN